MNCFNKQSLKYLSNLQQQVTQKDDLNARLPGIGKDLMNLIKEMLNFNPGQRFSAQECLQSKVFDDIRSLEIEKPSPI
jgi:serine/threonine protein kinase